MFKHYGVDVNIQLVRDFEKALKDNNIEYVALPYLNDIVFRYEYNGKKKYAYVVPTVMDDDSYAEKVYTTDEIPEDLSWRNIARDSNFQSEGEPPMELPTRARVIYDSAQSKVMERTPFSFDSLGPNPDKREMELEVMAYGVTIEDLKAMDHHDCPELDEGY